jgi:cysteine desulfuration protein SufE
MSKSTSTPAAAAHELVENFELLGDWEERYAYIIDLGKKLPAMPEEAKTDQNRIFGCQSRVWLIVDETGDGADSNGSGKPVLAFRTDSDAFIVKGLLSILMLIYNHRSPSAILSFEVEDLFEQLGLHKHLSPTRKNGLHEVVKRIRALAAARNAAS